MNNVEVVQVDQAPSSVVQEAKDFHLDGPEALVGVVQKG